MLHSFIITKTGCPACEKLDLTDWKKLTKMSLIKDPPLNISKKCPVFPMIFLSESSSFEDAKPVFISLTPNPDSKEHPFLYTAQQGFRYRTDVKKCLEWWEQQNKKIKRVYVSSKKY